MSFVNAFNALPLKELVAACGNTTVAQARESLNKPHVGYQDFVRLISPAASEILEPMCQRAHHLTQQRFGKVIRLFAPIYVSNECVNNCKYCGFSRNNPILRVTLSLDEVVREARAIHALGFRNLLLVAGEHPKFVSNDYLADCIRVLHDEFPSISLEVAPMETEDYRKMVAAGADGLVVYQETYDRAVYADMHTSGPKRDFDWRLETPERAHAAGFKRLGISPLYGLSDWRLEAISMAAHAQYLQRHCWTSTLTISMPRLRPHAGHFTPLTHMGDRELVQLIAALRLFLPDAGLVLSTRESATLRNGLMNVGITLMSAGSHTEPGGYTGAGNDKLHLTEHGRIRALSQATASTGGTSTAATVQFNIADERSPQEVAEYIRSLGYEPVWKDWDTALN